MTARNDIFCTDQAKGKCDIIYADQNEVTHLDCSVSITKTTKNKVTKPKTGPPVLNCRLPAGPTESPAAISGNQYGRHIHNPKRFFIPILVCEVKKRFLLILCHGLVTPGHSRLG